MNVAKRRKEGHESDWSTALAKQVFRVERLLVGTQRAVIIGQRHAKARRQAAIKHAGLFQIVETRQAWNSTVKICPGIGKGPLIQIEDSIATAQLMKSVFPEDYPAR